MAKLNNFLAVLWWASATVMTAGLIDSTVAVKLHVTANDPVVLGTSITLSATLENVERNTYQIAFAENSPGGRSKQDILNPGNHYTSNWTIIYSESHKPGVYSITTTVYYDVIVYYITVATKVTSYRVTPTFEGKLFANQTGRSPKVDPSFLTTTNETELFVEIHDPTSYLSKAVNVTYTWSQNNTFLANTTAPSLKRNFTQEGPVLIQANLTALFQNSTEANSTTYYEKNGTIGLNVTVKTPIVNFTYTGTPWFRHGKLLELHITCDGSPSYSYCWMIKSGPYNHTGEETCSSPSETNDCDFQILRYFMEPGIYSLLIIIGNDVSHFVNQTTVNIYKVNRQPQFSIIIVPISCTILAVVLVIFGVAYYWENHVRYPVEIADFDFGQTDEEAPYTRFIDRLRNAIFISSRSSHSLLINPDENSQGGVSGVTSS